jgi:hypothetical protein
MDSGSYSSEIFNVGCEWERRYIFFTSTETLLETNRDVDLEINAEKTKYMISHHLN